MILFTIIRDQSKQLLKVSLISVGVLQKYDDMMYHQIIASKTVLYRIYSNRGTWCQDQIWRGCLFSKYQRTIVLLVLWTVIMILHLANESRTLNILSFLSPKYKTLIACDKMCRSPNRCQVGKNI